MLIQNDSANNTRQEPASQTELSISRSPVLSCGISLGPDWERCKLTHLLVGTVPPDEKKALQLRCGEHTIDTFQYESLDRALYEATYIGTALRSLLADSLNTKYRIQSISHLESLDLAEEIDSAPVILAIGTAAITQCGLAAHRLSSSNNNHDNVRILFAPDIHGAIDLTRLGNRHLIAPVTVATILKPGTVSIGYLNHNISPSLIIAEPSICKQLEKLDLPIFQSSLITDHYPAHNKFKQYQTLQKQGLPFPETILVRRTHLKQGDLVDAAKLLRSKDCLIKPVNAAQSRGVVIIDSNLEQSKKRALIRDGLKRYPEMALQEYIKNYPAAENVGFSTWNLRVLVTTSGIIDLEIRAGEIDGVVAISQGSKALEWCAESLFGKKPNTTQQAAFEQMDRELKELVSKFIKKNPSNLGLIGLDIIINSECQPVIIEVNTGPVGGLSTLVKLRHKLSEEQIFAGVDRQIDSLKAAFTTQSLQTSCPSNIMQYRGCVSSLDADPKLAFLEWPAITRGIESEELALILQMAALNKFKDCNNISEIARHNFVRELVGSPNYQVFRHAFALIMQKELPYDGSAAEIILRSLPDSKDCDDFARLCLKNKELLPQDLIDLLVCYRNLRQTGDSNDIIASFRTEIHRRLGDNLNSVMKKFPKEFRFVSEIAMGRTWHALPYLAHGLFSQNSLYRSLCADALKISRMPLLTMSYFQSLTINEISEFALRFMQEGDETSARALQKKYNLPIMASNYFLAGKIEYFDRASDALTLMLSGLVKAFSRNSSNK